jgi:flagellar hook-length control protein FliK
MIPAVLPPPAADAASSAPARDHGDADGREFGQALARAGGARPDGPQDEGAGRRAADGDDDAREPGAHGRAIALAAMPATVPALAVVAGLAHDARPVTDELVDELGTATGEAGSAEAGSSTEGPDHGGTTIAVPGDADDGGGDASTRAPDTDDTTTRTPDGPATVEGEEPAHGLPVRASDAERDAAGRPGPSPAASSGDDDDAGGVGERSAPSTRGDADAPAAPRPGTVDQAERPSWQPPAAVDAAPSGATGADATAVPLAGPATASGPAVPASPAAPAPTPPAPVAQQLVEHVTALATGPDGTHELTIELAPADLGRVQLEVRLGDGVLDVRVHADDPGTRRLLAGSLGDLRSALSEAGIAAGHLDVGDPRRDERSGTRRDPAMPTDDSTTDARAVRAPGGRPRPVDSSTNLDVLL